MASLEPRFKKTPPKRGGVSFHITEKERPRGQRRHQFGDARWVRVNFMAGMVAVQS
jgi:hypothetical protein